MGKTYKALPTSWYRHPKGSKQAKIAGARPGAIPPDTYDDIKHDPATDIPRKVALKLKKDGKSEEEIRQILVNRFKMKPHEIVKILDWVNKRI